MANPLDALRKARTIGPMLSPYEQMRRAAQEDPNAPHMLDAEPPPLPPSPLSQMTREPVSQSAPGTPVFNPSGPALDGLRNMAGGTNLPLSAPYTRPGALSPSGASDVWQTAHPQVPAFQPSKAELFQLINRGPQTIKDPVTGEASTFETTTPGASD